MAFDSLALRLVVAEVRERVLGGTIRHIEQANPHTFSFKVGRGVETCWLTLSAHSVHARAHLIEKPPAGQKQSYLADFLTTHLRRGKIVGVEQLGWDRILKLTVEPVSEEHIQQAPKAIIAEFMGKHSNIILVDATDDRILESWKRIDETMSRHREILPGEMYTLPPQQGKVDPLALDESGFSGFIEGRESVGWRQLFNQIDGLSPTLAKEIVARGAGGDLWGAYQEVIGYFDSESVSPCLLRVDDEPLTVSAMPLCQFPEAVSEPFGTMSEALAAYYEAVTVRERFESERRTLEQALARREVLLARRADGLRRDLARAEKAEEYRVQGELLLANLHVIDRGAREAVLQNYYSPELEMVAIALDPELSGSDNAQAYFKKYTKAKRGRSRIQQLLSDVEADQATLGAYVSRLEGADSLGALERLRTEFVANGYLKAPQRGKGKQVVGEGPFRRYTSRNGFQIYVGRNSQANDLLLRQIAKPRDMWLHAKQIHGSHVIIRNPENRPDIPMPTLLEAAQLAAYYSKAHHASHVPVDYTWVRYVVKRKGNVAGYVHYTREKTLYVEPGVPSGKNV